MVWLLYLIRSFVCMDILGASSSEAFSIFGYCESYYSLIIFREVSFVSEGHRKPETYRANLCD